MQCMLFCADILRFVHRWCIVSQDCPYSVALTTDVDEIPLIDGEIFDEIYEIDDER